MVHVTRKLAHHWVLLCRQNVLVLDLSFKRRDEVLIPLSALLWYYPKSVQGVQKSIKDAHILKAS